MHITQYSTKLMMLSYIMMRKKLSQNLGLLFAFYLLFELIFLLGDLNYGFINPLIKKYTYKRGYELANKLRKATYLVIAFIMYCAFRYWSM